MLPPMQLENYFFPRVTVVAQKEFEQVEDDDTTYELSVQKAVSEPFESNKYQVGVNIKVTSAEGKVAPYEVSLEVVGTFLLDPNFPEEKREKLLLVNGCSMLYGMCREFLMSTTSRGPWGGFMLPTISFYPSPKEEEG